jgi:hypothetical protein
VFPWPTDIESLDTPAFPVTVFAFPKIIPCPPFVFKEFEPPRTIALLAADIELENPATKHLSVNVFEPVIVFESPNIAQAVPSVIVFP